jgi:hypothetical protein
MNISKDELERESLEWMGMFSQAEILAKALR